MSFVVLGATSARAEKAGKIVVSSPPLHSIVSLIAGRPAPTLLASGRESFHHAALTPSARRAAEEADFFFYGDPEVEPLSAALLPALPKTVKAASLENDARGSHVWMTPEGAAFVAKKTVETLTERNPDDAKKYRRRYDAFIEKNAELDAFLTDTLAPVKEAPFIVYHDAYADFAKKYSLNLVGYVTKNPEASVSGKKMREMRRLIAKKKPVCLFVEKGEGEALASALAEGTGTRVAFVNPDGAGMTPGKKLYPRLMKQLAKDMRACLENTDKVE
ncbi:MAG: zinc ABC transporter substrate-binding protein [Rickettsiales bacterium]